MTDGKNTGVDEATEAKQEFSLISNDTLMDLYRGLLKRRGTRKEGSGWRFDAAVVAVAQDLLPDDTVIADGNGAGGSAFARELLRGLGAALTHKTKKSGNVTVVYGGKNQVEAWTDALEVARVHRLPIVFVSGPSEQRTHEAHRVNGAEMEPGTELPHIIVDGNDVVASYRVAHEAIDRARRNRGATLMECTSFRVAGQRHQGAIASIESYLRGKGLLRRGLRRQMTDAIASGSKAQRP